MKGGTKGKKGWRKGRRREEMKEEEKKLFINET